MNDYEKKRLLSKVLLRNNFIWEILKRIMPGCNKFKINSLYEYCVDNSLIIEMIDENTKREIRVPAKDITEYEKGRNIGTMFCDVSRIYSAEIENVYIRSHMDGVVKDGYYLTDRIEWDKEGLPLYPPNTGIAMSTDSIILYQMENIKYIEKGIFLLKEFAENIFHFTVEVIARLEFIDRLGRYDDWPLLLDEGVKKDYRTLQLIEVMNPKNHPIIWIKTDEPIMVKDLVIPPQFVWGQRSFFVRNVLRISPIMDKQIPSVIREKVFANYKPRKVYSKVYVERGNNDRFVNESEMKGYLLKNGFEIFNPDKGDFWDEIDCFSTADVIVLCAGGAQVNLLYIKENAIVYNICPFEYQASSAECFREAMNLKDVRYISARVVKRDKDLNKSQFYLEKEKYKRIVDETIAQ